MFRFRLQRVLDLRERSQRDAATALVTAQDQADQARDEALRLVAVRQALAEQSVAPVADASAGASVGASVGELRNLHFLLSQLDAHVATAATAATTAEQTVAKRQDELRTAFRERHTLDRLRERHQLDWRSAEAAADRQQMDEIALSRFTQASAHTPGSPPGGSQTPSRES